MTNKLAKTRLFFPEGVCQESAVAKKQISERCALPNSWRKERGFTLIELLVVVLIIGILAAVAVPQYQKAVRKSRFVQMTTAIKSIFDAQDIYYLENGKHATTFEELGLDLGKIDPNNSKYIWMGKTNCALDNASQFTCNFGYTWLIVQNWYDLAGQKKYQQCCVYPHDNFAGEELCQELKNKNTWADHCGGCHCY